MSSAVAALPRRGAPEGAAAPVRVVGARTTAWGAAGFFFALYGLLSVLHHRQMLTGGFDLGIFEQAVKAYAHGDAPVVPLKGPGVNVLGDHFSPIVAVLAPLYALFPGSVTLLLAQAALASVSLVPMVGWAFAACGRRAAYWVAFTMGCSWGLVQMVYFDFHEVAFGVPLLSFSLAAAGQRRWSRAALWALPLVLVKEDLGLTVACLGGYLVFRGRRRLGVLLALFGLAATGLEMGVLIPAMSRSGAFSYGSQVSSASAGLLASLFSVFVPLRKWVTAVMLVATTGFSALRSPIVFLVLPTLGWRFAADNPQYWTDLFHYNAILMPVVFAAAIDARANGKSLLGLRATLVVSLLFTTAMIPRTHLVDIAAPRMWATSAHNAAAQRLIARIPDGVTVNASNRIAVRLISRTTVSLPCPFTYSTPLENPEWVIVDAADPTGSNCSFSRLAQTIGQEPQDGYRLVSRQEGISLLARTAG
ncbi:DUF2079 domain-containing protein [Kitasatospora sp. NPDC004272]